MSTIESLKTLLRMRIASCAALFLAFPVAGYASGPVFTEQPRVAANSNPKVPQAAVVTFASDRPVSTTFSVSADDENWEWELLLHDPSEEDPVSWALFGAEHIPNWQVVAAGN